MAKGQKKSSKEIRKPKKDKTVVAATSSFGSQVKQSPATMPAGKGTKG